MKTRVLACDELETNKARRVVVDDTPIALVKDESGEIFAIGDVCTHGEISLSEGFVGSETLECWAHGSKFSLRTGIPLNLPAYEPVPVYTVDVIDGDIYIDPTITTPTET